MRQVKKTIWLTENRHTRFITKGHDFHIKKLKNSTEFHVGNYIAESDVDFLIRNGWDVIIREK